MRSGFAACALAALVLMLVPQVSQGSDEEAIRATALDYLEGWYGGDAARMERALHPDLAKRIVRFDKARQRDRVDHMGAMQLVQYARAGYGTRTPVEKQQKDVEILDVYENMATVKTIADTFVDYIHIAKVDDEWKIVNVLWAMKPRASSESK